MKKAILFKTLVDILYILHFFGLIGIVFFIPFGISNTNQINMNIEDWSWFHWFISIISFITYIIFLRGLFFLRKMAKFLLANKYFSEEISVNLKKSGNHFLSTGIISFIILFILWLNKLYGGKLVLTYDINLLIPLFLTTIGVFFIIQSNTLILAKHIKDENELTI